jgi:hypothetical protein
MSTSTDKSLAPLIKATLKANTADNRMAVALQIQKLGHTVETRDPWVLFAAKVIGSSDAEVAVIYDQLCRTAFRAFAAQDRMTALQLALADDPAGFHKNSAFTVLFDSALSNVVLKT